MPSLVIIRNKGIMEKLITNIAQLEEQIQHTQESLNALNAKLEEWKSKKLEEEEMIGLKCVIGSKHYYTLSQLHDGTVDFTTRFGPKNSTRCPVFTNVKQASNFADAFQVMLELRAQPGLFKVDKAARDYYLLIFESEGVVVAQFPNKTILSTSMFPRYRTAEHAENAIRAVGNERIIRAAKTLSFVE